MAAADPRGLHAARGGEVGGPEADAVHARRGRGDRLDVVDALGGFQDGVDQDRLFDGMPGLELGQELIEIMDVPRALDLGQHDDVELAADRGDDSVMSSSAQGEFSALIRVHRPVAPKSTAFAIAMKPVARLRAWRRREWRPRDCPSTTSTWRTSSGTLAVTFSMCGGTKWIIRSSRTGSSRNGAGAPIASGSIELSRRLHDRSLAVLPKTRSAV